MLTQQQLLDWMDYHGREPFGFPIADAQFAMLQNTIVRANGGSNSSFDDFTLFGKSTGEGEENLEADDMLERLKALLPEKKEQSTG